jgi:hypothetical protein
MTGCLVPARKRLDFTSGLIKRPSKSLISELARCHPLATIPAPAEDHHLAMPVETASHMAVSGDRLKS